jgi:hypothetical protein
MSSSKLQSHLQKQEQKKIDFKKQSIRNYKHKVRLAYTLLYTILYEFRSFEPFIVKKSAEQRKRDFERNIDDTERRIHLVTSYYTCNLFYLPRIGVDTPETLMFDKYDLDLIKYIDFSKRRDVHIVQSEDDDRCYTVKNLLYGYLAISI